jgi:hypothetical protein
MGITTMKVSPAEEPKNNVTGFEGDADCVFRPKSITDSGRSRSLIPVHADHRFRSKSITPEQVSG